MSTQENRTEQFYSKKKMYMSRIGSEDMTTKQRPQTMQQLCTEFNSVQLNQSHNTVNCTLCTTTKTIQFGVCCFVVFITISMVVVDIQHTIHGIPRNKNNSQNWLFCLKYLFCHSVYSSNHSFHVLIVFVCTALQSTLVKIFFKCFCLLNSFTIDILI